MLTSAARACQAAAPKAGGGCDQEAQRPSTGHCVCPRQLPTLLRLQLITLRDRLSPGRATGRIQWTVGVCS